MDPVKILPTEVFEQILSYLDIKDLCSCCLVSQKWSIAANNDSLWKLLCLKNDWHDSGRLNDLAGGFNFFSSDDKNIFHNLGEWKKNFVLNMRLRNNWHVGNAKDLLVEPRSCDHGDDITTVYSDGDKVVAFGFNNGVIKLYDLKKECKLALIKECFITSPVTHIQIVNEYLLVLQKNLFLVYKYDDDLNLDLHNIKIIKGTIVDNVDIPIFTALERNYRSIILNDVEASIAQIIYINDDYMMFAPKYSHIVNVYSFNFDLSEPDLVFALNTDSACFIYNVHVKDDVLYALLGEHGTIIMMVQAYSLKCKTLLFNQDIVEFGFRIASRINAMESNEKYLLVKFEYNMFVLLDKDSGKLLLEESGVVFLNANSNPQLIGILLDDSFQLVDPSVGNVMYCITLEGLPLALHSNIIVTLSLEYDKDCVAAGEVEFWNMYNTSQEISRIKFPKHSDVTLIYEDDTKLIFYASQNSCLVRNFMV